MSSALGGFKHTLISGLESPVIAQTDMLMIRELRRMGGLIKSNFETLRNAGAGRELLEFQEEVLRKMGQAIDRLAAGNHDR